MAEGKCYRVAGFEVRFPHEAYGVQKVFMNQVLRAIHNEENALLEAPTGCGKTLSLLCAALAWQDALKQKKAAGEQVQREKAEAKAAEVKAGSCLGPVKQNSEDKAAHTSDVDEPDAPVEEIIVPKIYYATRTHSQIAQVVRELKRTAYRPRMTVLGSRPHYCINKSALRHPKGVDAACEEMMKDQQGGCRFKKNAMTLTHGLVKVHDIEDLAKIGTRHKACPYFAARHLAETADLIFCPYSYLLDPNIRRATKVQAADAVLIFDEAHNIEDQAREAGSIDLELEQLKQTFIALRVAAGLSNEADVYEPLAEAVLEVIDWLTKLGEQGTEQGGFRSSGFERFERLWTGEQMIAALQEAGLGPQAVEHLWTCYEKARAAEEKAGFNTEGEAADQPVPANITSPRAGGSALGCVSSLLTVLRLLYGSYSEASSLQLQEVAQGAGAAGSGRNGAVHAAPAVRAVQMNAGDHAQDYRLAVHMWVPRGEGRGRGRGRGRAAAEDTTDADFASHAPGSTKSSWGMSLGIWCLNPSVVFKCLSDVARSVLLASGTLSPLDTFSGELGLTFHVKLEAPHVVDMRRQVMARVVSHGPDGRQLCATYKEADKLDYQDSLGRLVLEVVQVVPDGVLLFLPSYVLMDKLSERWKATGIWGEIERLKHIIAEPRRAGDEFDAAISQYYKAVREDGGGLFMAVCRGKASEGIDFADGNARCVIVVGIPFPNVKDSKVGLKKDYNNASATAYMRPGSRPGPWQQGTGGGAAAMPKLLSGDQWYSQQAFRALNQAVGRCIRHRHDYGAILLVDERFRQPRHQQCLSKWVRGAIGTAQDTPKLIHELQCFFEGLEANPPGSITDTAAAAVTAAAAAAVGVGKPGYEGLVLSKPGYEQGPVMQGKTDKPGYESGVAAAAGNGVPWHLQDSVDDRLRKKAGYEAGVGGGSGSNSKASHAVAAAAVGSSKPGCDVSAGGGCGSGPCGAAGGGNSSSGTTQDRWRAPGWAATAVAGQQGSEQQRVLQQQQQPHHHHQQQQQQQQSDNKRLSGPMDASLHRDELPMAQQQQQWQPVQVKQEQQQWQQQQQENMVHIKSEPAELQAASSSERRRSLGEQLLQQNTTTHGVMQQTMQPPLQQQHNQAAVQQSQQQQHLWQPYAQQQNRQYGQPVSCVNMVSTCQLPKHQERGRQDSAKPSMQHEEQPQVSDTTTGQFAAVGVMQAQPVVPESAPSTEAAAAAANQAENGVQAAMPNTSSARAGIPDQAPAIAADQNAAMQQHQQPQAAGQQDAPAATTVTAQAAAACSGGHAPNNSSPVQQQNDKAATAGPNSSNSSSSLSASCESLGVPVNVLRQWVSSDVSAMRQQLRQQGVSDEGTQGHGIMQLACFGIMGSFELAADICQQQQQSPSLSSFWPVWHSHVPLGLLAVAAAAGQLPPAQPQQQQLQGPWLGVMQKRTLLKNLCGMAEAYDEALDCKLEQQQHLPQQPPCQPQHHSWQCQQAQPLQQQQQQHSWQPTGVQAPQPQQQWQQQVQQQQGWQQQGQPQLRQHDAVRQQLPQQQQQQQYAVPQPQQQPVPGQLNLSNARMVSAVQGAMLPRATAAAAGTAVHPWPAQDSSQLSQSARQPKRAAHRSEKAQLAAQKRSKQQQSARLAAALPPPKAQSTAAAPAAKGRGADVVLGNDDDDDDFM